MIGVLLKYFDDCPSELLHFVKQKISYHNDENEAGVDRVAVEYYQKKLKNIYYRVDRVFVKLMIVEFLAGIACAWLVSPLTRNDADILTNSDLLLAIFLGAAILGVPVYMGIKHPGKYLTRQVIAIGQVLFSALLIHLTGGRIETHFHVFGSLALISLYKDWRVLLSASAIVGLDHLLRGMFWPETLYSIVVAPKWAWLEHFGWIVFEDVFLVQSCIEGKRELFELSYKSAVMKQQITSLNIAREQYEDKTNVFEQVLEETMAGYWDWHIKEDKEYMSPTLKKMLGYEDDEIENTSKWVQDNIHPEDLPAVLESYDRHIVSKGAFPYDNEVRFYHKNGHIVWVYRRGSVIEWDEDGQPVRMVGSHVDITELKQSEEQIKISQKELLDQAYLFKTLLNSAPDAMIIINELEKIYLVNSQVKIMFGYEESEILMKPIKSLIANGNEEKENLFIQILKKDIINNDDKESFEITLVDKFGNEFPAEVSLSPMKMDKTTLVIAAVRDITDRKKAEKMKSLAQETKIRNRELEQFAYVASHDLREPLVTVENMIQLLKEESEGVLSEDSKTYLKYIDEASRRMDAQIKALLDYSRIGKSGSPTLLNCNTIVKSALANLDYCIKKNKAKIEVKNLPEINGLEVELIMLFQNLISNAIKYVNKDVVPCVVLFAEDKKDRWKFVVKDNGIGIDEKHLTKIFEAFQRLHSKDEYEGTGIGLAHCKKIVELHGGKIWAESIEGKGTSFCFTIPK